jgi:adenosylcobinamide-GDP ribazoletransferase
MSAVRSAVALLTRIPVATEATDAPGAAAFGVVGAAVGLVGAIPLAVLGGPLGEPGIAAIAAIAVMTLVTGALHMDGLADTADALMARDREAAERARKDPILGAGGVIALVLVIAVEIAALISIVTTAGPVAAGLALIAVATASRAMPILVTFTRRASISETPLGSWFAEAVTDAQAAVAVGSAAAIVAVLSVAAASLVDGGSGAAVVVAVGGGAGGLVGALLAAFVVALRHGLDGDGLGAAVELSVVAGLVAAALVA